MEASEREHLNLRTIRVTLDAALRHGDPATTVNALRSARRLFEQARDAAADPAVRAEADRLLERLRGSSEHESYG